MGSAKSKPKAKGAKPNTKLTRLRESKGWTMEELARKAGVSSQTVSKAERGIKITGAKKGKIAGALSTSIEALFENSR